MTPLRGWENFYVIAGSSAGALIGLQFVVITLIANLPLTVRDAQAGDSFSTPSVVHFGVVLLLSAASCAPWEDLVALAVLWGFIGLAGDGYVLVVARRLRRQTAYEPVLEDRLFHVYLPFAAYTMMIASAGLAHAEARPALFLVAGSVLLLLLLGIHNAWDIITYHVFAKRQKDRDAGGK